MKNTPDVTSRREFIRKSTLAGAAASLIPGARVLGDRLPPQSGKASTPAIVSSGNGIRAVEKALEVIQGGGDALDAVIEGVNIVEADPEDITVGYGGVPNEQGDVELDSSVMYGPTCRAGAVAALQGIKHPSKVARLVMERTDHCLLVGKGAQAFAVMHGFEVENLLTERARKLWVNWKETLSNRDDYLPPHDPEDKDIGADLREIKRSYGTIHCSGLDLNGNIASVTTTSGLFYKIPGRVGDSPIIGAGLYTDNEVGAAGSTGRGEANLENLSSFLIVERMRMGDSPEQACLYACQRIVEHTILGRLKREDGTPNFNVRFYALNKAGEMGGAEIRGPGQMAIADADGPRMLDMAYLYKRA